MCLGNSLYKARKKSGFSQEDVAAKLGVSRQTISKWETDETLPDIRQARKLASLYHLSLDELLDFDAEVQEIEQVIENTSEELQQKINWTKMWAKKYPVLSTYHETVNTLPYVQELRKLLDRIQNEYGYNDTDAFLVLKDILAQIWNQKD